jgi:hypothetical protein
MRSLPAALLVLPLLASCGGATPKACHVKYMERRRSPDKYEICMERYRLRAARAHMREDVLPPPQSVQTIVQPSPLVVADVGGVMHQCTLRVDGIYACSPMQAAAKKGHDANNPYAGEE